jgi:hypothetical protein
LEHSFASSLLRYPLYNCKKTDKRAIMCDYLQETLRNNSVGRVLQIINCQITNYSQTRGFSDLRKKIIKNVIELSGICSGLYWFIIAGYASSLTLNMRTLLQAIALLYTVLNTAGIIYYTYQILASIRRV